METKYNKNQRKACDSIKKLVKLGKQDQSKQRNVTISMVPKTLRELNPDAYTPRIIPIGPLHKENEHLKTMEDHKLNYMYRLFCRTVESTKNDITQIAENDITQIAENDIKQIAENNITQIADKCIQAVFGLVKKARDCYEKSFRAYDDLKFAEMMVIDGCFILELLCKYRFKTDEADLIFDNYLVMHDVKFDMLLLENQIPFFILNKLFSLTVEMILPIPTSLTDLIFLFFDDMNFLKDSKFPTINEEVEHCHILGLLQSCYKLEEKNFGVVPTISYSATEISRAGVTFKAQKHEVNAEKCKFVAWLGTSFRGLRQSCFKPRATRVPTNSNSATENTGVAVTSNSNSLLAVEFKQSSQTLFVRETTSFEIPVLNIKDSTISFLRNLIAFEQCYPFSGQYVTSFAYLMDKFIDTTDDVSLLVRSKVLHHNLGSGEDITKLFNDICKGVVHRNFYYTEEWEQLDKYCNCFWPGILILLRRLYRSTTWKTLTVIVAMIIFILTLLQTIYTIRSA